MDQNTELILAKSAKAENWEDREKATDDLAVLREEFRNRLYSRESDQGNAQPIAGKPTDK